MKARILTGLIYGLLVLIYLAIYAGLHNPIGIPLKVLYEQLWLVAIALMAPSLASGLFIGRMLTGTRSALAKIVWAFLIAFIAHWLYYYIAYVFFIMSNPQVLSTDPTLPTINPTAGVYNFMRYVVYEGSIFAASLSVLQSFFVIVPGTLIALAMLRKIKNR